MNALLQARYAEDHGFEAHLNETVRSIMAHKTCRHYLPQPLAPGLLETLVAAAQSAPSSCNMQSWSVVVVTDPDAKAKLAAITGNQQHVIQAPVLLCFLADLARVEAVAAQNEVPSEALDYLEMLLVGVIDASIAAQTLSIAAESLGLGTSYIGSLRNDVAEVVRLLGLPKRVTPVFGMALGYPDPARPANVKPRLAPSAVMHLGSYDARAAVEPVARYEDALEAFNANEGRAVARWGLHSARRISGIERMEGRDKLWPILREQALALK